MEEAKITPALVLRRVIHAKRDRVFAAWSDPEKMSQWFIGGPGTPVVTNDFRVGGKFENRMNIIPVGEHKGCQTTTGPATHVHTGEYLEIIPEEKLVFTWNSPSVTNTRVTIELRDLGDSTELTLTHELIETESLREGHTEGWNVCLTNLSSYLG